MPPTNELIFLGMLTNGAYNQIWLYSLLDGCNFVYITKLKEKNMLLGYGILSGRLFCQVKFLILLYCQFDVSCLSSSPLSQLLSLTFTLPFLPS